MLRKINMQSLWEKGLVPKTPIDKPPEPRREQPGVDPERVHYKYAAIPPGENRMRLLFTQWLQDLSSADKAALTAYLLLGCIEQVSCLSYGPCDFSVQR
jgi:hypothetical protein